MQKKIVFFYTVYLEAKKWMKKYFIVNNQKFGNRLLIEFMFKNLYYFIVLEN